MCLIRSIIINASKLIRRNFVLEAPLHTKANAEDEYQECLLKANALFKVLA
jgi:anthranilate/para-aminobenzoate synthase component I